MLIIILLKFILFFRSECKIPQNVPLLQKKVTVELTTFFLLFDEMHADVTEMPFHKGSRHGLSFFLCLNLACKALFPSWQEVKKMALGLSGRCYNLIVR